MPKSGQAIVSTTDQSGPSKSTEPVTQQVPVGGEPVTTKNAAVSISSSIMDSHESIQPMDTSETNATSEILTSLGKVEEKKLLIIQGICLKMKEEYKMAMNSGLMQAVELENMMRDRLKNLLQLPFDDSARRSKDLAFVVHDFLSNGNQPTKPAQEIICSIWNPLSYLVHSWLEMCCQMLMDEQIFSAYYQALGRSELSLQEVVENNPDMLMNEQSDDLLQRRLIANLDFEFLHRKIMSNLNEDGQTVMFTTRTFIPWVMLYTDVHDKENDRDPRVTKLYDLLKICDTNGNSALHVNTHIITQILKYSYSIVHDKELKELINTEDRNGRRADPNGETELKVLRDHIEDNRYLLYGKPLVLIIYTIENRPGAKEEAEKIRDAFEATGRFRVEMKPDKRKEDIINIIVEEAKKEEYPGVKQSALIVVLMSHGAVGVVHDRDRKSLPLRYIEIAMCSKQLKGRPKIFIAQACQEVSPMERDGNDGVPSDRNRTGFTPTQPHFCAIMSCLSGQASVRNVFIPNIADEIIKLLNEDATKGQGTCITKIVANVKQKMKGAEKSSTQTPIIMSTLKSEFRLAKH